MSNPPWQRILASFKLTEMAEIAKVREKKILQQQF